VIPEGPVALSDGSVLVVEMAARRLNRAGRGRTEVVAELGGCRNGAAIGPDGRVYVANNGGYNFAPQAGELRPVGEY
jgi:gluconolactonase